MNPLHSDHTRGFTLLEVMIAVAILAIGLVTLIGSQSQSISLVTVARFEGVAALLAQEKLTELRLQAFEEVSTDQGEFGEEFAGYIWKTQVTELGEDDVGIVGVDESLKSVYLTVSLEGVSERSLTVQTILFKEIEPGDD
ncbi:type IV pilus modification PilV family protein [Desulfogranum mediterraneum]|uniref:type IV pilus modification PilV family protein n=1 Tax=Desulfogranum mediterraneum TaxID=160661 RepID=UPI00040D9D0D|nr:prepilin-type N-terminal cleavage/methylation domain-containing protein [Desulfogranum mediterraneum]